MKLEIKKFSSDHGKLYCHFHYEEAVKRLGVGKGGIGGFKPPQKDEPPLVIQPNAQGQDLSQEFQEAAQKRATKQAAERPDAPPS